MGNLAKNPNTPKPFQSQKKSTKVNYLLPSCQNLRNFHL
ncbi:hypothetical protein O53_307 [Microcystis aeruginosa TAIHU98]|uniref:Uncharacterized protein n=1 Tax=Microcystis aeruginosa TAIHU98 TaxID=1134457 RepID=L7EAL6_MICAE|nr:hypothetical protein O53_307 [Microcystis aeruginosa TAIHU98]